MSWNYNYHSIFVDNRPIDRMYKYLYIGLLIRLPVMRMLEETKCSIAITFDNLLNGNISVREPKYYFTGTTSIENMMKNITGDLSTT